MQIAATSVIRRDMQTRFEGAKIDHQPVVFVFAL